MPIANSKSSPSQNPFILAAENSPALLPLLQSNPGLAAAQDEHGYSLLHAAASYSHLHLAKYLRSNFKISPDIKDEDGETALFVVETVETAQCMLEDVGIDPSIKNTDGLTAEDKIREEGDFLVVAEYLSEVRLRGHRPAATSRAAEENLETDSSVPPLPPGVQVRLGQLEDEANIGEVADPELKQRIEELAARDDFQGDESQRQLRELVTDALKGTIEDQREVRRRTE
ncbi:uncharacterized protein KY384_002029 [Bacidia gigantensis]|uniref:uncharacterized protein n=1 Tax=Bacidia gigantensis TaxID=2732470 RepID=UPI001D04653F|nr:uncharacterized protein KY384_002029 [Bacidia gigantensis]KAG8533246.1 hypothetical protein KY384_002029 [Bacidia gigantensis]